MAMSILKLELSSVGHNKKVSMIDKLMLTFNLRVTIKLSFSYVHKIYKFFSWLFLGRNQFAFGI